VQLGLSPAVRSHGGRGIGSRNLEVVLEHDDLVFCGISSLYAWTRGLHDGKRLDGAKKQAGLFRLSRDEGPVRLLYEARVTSTTLRCHQTGDLRGIYMGDTFPQKDAQGDFKGPGRNAPLIREV